MKRPKNMLPDEILKPGDEGYVEPITPPVTPPEGGKEVPAEEPKVKIGDVEYTPEQLTEALKDSKDYKELLPKFTVTSQTLSKLLGGGVKDLEQQENLPSFLKPGWKPGSFEELGKALKEAVEWGEKRSQKATEDQTTKVTEAKEQVDNFVAEVKKANKDFDDKDFFEYVNRHEIEVKTVKDLKSAYSTYMEANIDGKAAERRALINKTKRGSDSVSVPSSEGEKLPYDPHALRARGLSIVDAAKEALSKFK